MDIDELDIKIDTMLCPVCGKMFTRLDALTARGNESYCSSKCIEKSTHIKTPYTMRLCARCGKEFPSNKKIYCSKSCQSKFERTHEFSIKMSKSQKARWVGTTIETRRWATSHLIQYTKGRKIPFYKFK